jgi:hypothetical protein
MNARPEDFKSIGHRWTADGIIYKLLLPDGRTAELLCTSQVIQTLRMAGNEEGARCWEALFDKNLPGWRDRPPPDLTDKGR